jgi:hypothetical protein
MNPELQNNKRARRLRFLTIDPVSAGDRPSFSIMVMINDGEETRSAPFCSDRQALGRASRWLCDEVVERTRDIA